MPVLIAYLLVVLIWGTTPLAIHWSNGAGSVMAAVCLRMLIALALALMINAVIGKSLFDRPGVWKAYLAAAIGIFPNMPLVYWSAQFIPSGLMAVVFAFSPFVTGLLCWLMLGDNPFNRRRLLALVVALAGLGLVFAGQLRAVPGSAPGVLGMLLSCGLFSFSSVWLKRLDMQVDAFNQTAGALMFALPGLLLLWWFTGGHWQLDSASLAAIVYLAIGGSLLGFTLFFYVLARLPPTVVSLITLVTPVVAIVLGALLAQERPAVQVLVGAGLVLLALVAYLEVFSKPLGDQS
ncbi:DMT family transporter [Gilvimarinus algae]|uniref:DMT family transporter n=1 Tax=Gilvimarinus algae TaxID=3058037 RepID=A0ABT8THX9_9GAMM|nr:DMT family transporter [Gilvimarinus sp. SDUM040014]MDO3383526.1 DMT family transporter [Gilvimarinus sp. SDUM040014]